ncbi:Putative extracellular membrane protein, CFEM [Colletotrichum destructivum]|uniref:Extracellular membrane protein, CFEM n=1 Tax=Colletotrichum destructivum TaxID=34406 RepID=A0AAX4I0D1_9PEZI|nr:Putative extracellular membrane protein, CFEM [Colletotrichum destructivum]
MSTTLATPTTFNATLGHNGSVSTGLGQLAVELPECVALCIRNELPKAACNSANSTCVCTSESLNNAIGVCVKANCTIIEALRT